jgi:hypothetical protein
MFNTKHPIFLLRLKICFLRRLILLRKRSIVNKGWYKLLILNWQLFELPYWDMTLLWCFGGHRALFWLLLNFFSLCRNSHRLWIWVMSHDDCHIQISFFMNELLDRRCCLNKVPILIQPHISHLLKTGPAWS